MTYGKGLDITRGYKGGSKVLCWSIEHAIEHIFLFWRIHQLFIGYFL